jgi:hypothetical protein
MLAGVYADLAKKARARRQTKFALHADKKATAHFQDSIESAGQIGANAAMGQVYRDWGRVCQESPGQAANEICHAC